MDNRRRGTQISAMDPFILHDADVTTFARMPDLVAVIERCLLAKAEGRLVAPPRHSVAFETGQLVFTIGGIAAAEGATDGIAGFRVYETFRGAGSARAQLVAVWDSGSGDLRGLVVGDALGVLRTGAIGGVAIDRMARPDVRTCGIIGSGKQAESQLMAAVTVRPGLETIRIYSRNARNREDFAERMSGRVGRSIQPVADARDAVLGADLVLCATDSGSPVIETQWLARGVHVTTLGPKLVDHHELPRVIGDIADLAATDSPAQFHAYAKPHFLEGTPAGRHMLDLADIVAGRVAGRRSPTDITLFCSVGLAGTEVAVADALLRQSAVAGGRSK
jgi:ornithine cyclodeaminase/alanine dehydrogenase-like protein (mu-crystallin family)